MIRVIARTSTEGRALNKALREKRIPDSRIIRTIGDVVTVNAVTMDCLDLCDSLASYNGRGRVIGRGVRVGADAYLRPMVEPLDD